MDRDPRYDLSSLPRPPPRLLLEGGRRGTAPYFCSYAWIVIGIPLLVSGVILSAVSPIDTYARSRYVYDIEQHPTYPLKD